MQYRKIIVSIVLLAFILGICAFPSVLAQESEPQKQYIVSTYVTPWNWRGLPDPTKVTHINYSFASVDVQTHEVSLRGNGWDEKNELYVSQLVKFRDENPHLKLLVSIGGAEADGFSQAAETEEGREIFAQTALDMINEYNLDGVDIDWENPVNGGWGTIRAIPEDRENCTLLIKKLRETIGDDKIISFADGVTDQSATWVEYSELNKYVDFFNMMSYCFSAGAPLKHDSNLYPSKFAAWGGIYGVSAHMGVQMHLREGIPPEKIVMGLNYYGVNFEHENNAETYGDLIRMLNKDGYNLAWDDDAKSHYIADPDGNMAATLNTPLSIYHKSEYVKEHGLGGFMVWEYGQDDVQGTLRTATYESLNGLYTATFTPYSTRSYHSIFGAEDGEVPFLIENEKAMIPLRISAGVVGAESCDWIEETQQIKITFNDKIVIFTIDSAEVQLLSRAGEVIETSAIGEDETPRLIGNRTYLPARVLSAAAGYCIEYVAQEDGEYIVFSPESLTKEEMQYTTANASLFIAVK